LIGRSKTDVTELSKVTIEKESHGLMVEFANVFIAFLGISRRRSTFIEAEISKTMVTWDSGFHELLKSESTSCSATVTAASSTCYGGDLW
jgi:hypothetical protein